MNSFVPSGTVPPVRSGTRSPCFRGPESPESSRSSTACSARNFPNLKSFGFFLTDRGAFSTTVDRHPQSSRPDRNSALLSCEAGHHTKTKPKHLNQHLTNRPIRRYDFVFDCTPIHASARANALSSPLPLSKVRRHLELRRQFRRCELARFAISALLGRNAGCSAALTLRFVKFSAQPFSSERAAA